MTLSKLIACIFYDVSMTSLLLKVKIQRFKNPSKLKIFHKFLKLSHQCPSVILLLLVSFPDPRSHSHTRATMISQLQQTMLTATFAYQMTIAGAFTNAPVTSNTWQLVCTVRIPLESTGKSASPSVPHQPIIKQCYDFTNFNIRL